jgi:hypothetical protein
MAICIKSIQGLHTRTHELNIKSTSITRDGNNMLLTPAIRRCDGMLPKMKMAALQVASLVQACWAEAE